MKPKSKSRQVTPPSEKPATGRNEPATPDPCQLPLGKRLLFGFIALVVLPLLGLCLVEASLRLAGYGYPTTFFLPGTIQGKTVWMENPRFGLRFFPPNLARSPSPTVMVEPKPAGVCRIFLFGESAALGDPRPAYGVGRYLETLLRDRFPGHEFEVVCVAMTAINSHALLPIARECARHEGDLWVVYMGNNEFYGPFGAGTVFGSQAPSTGAARAYLALQRARLGQWLVALSRKISAGHSPKIWGGLRMFLDQQLGPEDPRKLRVYENFRVNLNDLLEAGRNSKVPIILSTVASNLKDCAPLSSVHSPALSAVATNEWWQLYQAAITNALQGFHTRAVAQFQEALRLSPRHAELHFRLARSYLALTNLDEAKRGFMLARDLDSLPFRTDGVLNRTVVETAARYAGKGVVFFVDAEPALAPSVDEPIPGREFFHEHVHLNPEGNYRLARAFAEQAARCLPAAITNRQTPTWASFELCSKRLGLTDWNRLTILEEIGRRLAEAPLANRYDNADHLGQVRAAVARLKAGLTTRAARSAREDLEAVVRSRPGDHWLHHNLAEFLALTGDLPGATAEMMAVRDLLPHHHAAYLQIGRLLARQRKYDEAQQALGEAARLRPDVAEVRIELGQVAAARGQLDDALQHFAAAQANHEDDARVCLLRAAVLDKQNKRAEAVQSLREAIRLRPTLAEAYDQLGIRLAIDGNFAEAQAVFEEFVRLKPEDAEGYLNLGIALARQHKLEEARKRFQKTLELDPGNQRARDFLKAMDDAGR